MVLGLADAAVAQRARFGASGGGPMPATSATTTSPYSYASQVGVPPGTTAPAPSTYTIQPPPGTMTGGSAVAQPPVTGGFDAFSSGSSVVAPPPNSGFPGTVPPGAAYPPPGTPATIGAPAPAGYPGYPQNPSYLFNNPSSTASNWPGNALSGFEEGPYLKLFSDLRVRHTWINGDGGDDVDINDFETGVTMNYPDFLASGRPLRISPGFDFHLWSGPSPPQLVADLPGTAYGAHFDFDWMTAPEQPVGGEINFRFGLYSDFSTITSDSWRFTGTGLGRFSLTPTMTAKVGVEYIDRVDLKLLPAVGLFWRPNPDVALDIYFPRPRFARRWTRQGNTDLWLYLGGEYGGGSWTVKRASGFTDSIDINDIRIFGGIEWTGLRATKGFFEVGYVFNRELVYRYQPPGNLDLQDSFMLRTGFTF